LTRERRLTVRLADQEIASIKAFADEKHLIDSVALRWLIAVGLASEARSRPQNVHQTPVPTRPDQIG
jgi:hypothetical protein